MARVLKVAIVASLVAVATGCGADWPSGAAKKHEWVDIAIRNSGDAKIDQAGVLTISAVAALLSITLIVLILSRDSGITQTTLEDGSVLVLRKVAYGKKHRMTGGTWWQRLAGPFVPATIAKKWKIPVAVYTNTHPVLMVWVEHRTDSSTNHGVYPMSYGFVTPAPFALQDDAGTDFPQLIAAKATTPKGQIIGVPFQAVPRFSDNLSFRFTFSTLRPERHYSANVKFHNPLFDNKWRTTSVNSTTQNNLIIKLGDLRRWQISDYPGGPSENRTLLQCQITDLEDSSRGWLVVGVTIIGENGALYPCQTRRVGTDGKWDEYEFRPTLATNQAWPLRLELCRRLPGSNDLRTVRSIPVPGVSSGEPFTPVRIPLHGTTLVVRGFAISARASGAYETIEPTRLPVQATVEPPDNGLLVVLVQARSSDGEVLRIRQPNSTSAHDTSQLIIPFGVTHVDLTYALTPKVYADVFARPTR